MVMQRFLGFINDNRLIGPADRVLLAVSGGLDSIAMANLFHQAGLPFAIAHVNFGLRGADSIADAVFVQNVAEQYEVPFHLTHFDTTAVAAELGISIQMAARDLRYDWFNDLCQRYKYASVATAHHKNDVLETVLLNVIRGTGLAGLHGIAPLQDRGQGGRLIRPLLFATRDDLAAYVEEHKLTYREDSSNSSDKYARNRIRHQVVPVLAALNPGLWQTLPRSIERFRAAETLMRIELDRTWAELIERHNDRLFLPTEKLLAQTELTFRLTEWLKPYGFAAEQAEHMVASLQRPVGQVFLSATHRIVHDRQTGSLANGLFLEPLTPVPAYELTLTDWPTAPILVAGLFTVTLELLEKPSVFEPPPTSAIALLDADLLLFPLVIRPWRQGDRFRPLGLKGNKLVSNLLNDLKLDRFDRERTAVLESANQIAWVINHRIDQRFRVTSNSKRLVKIVYKKKAFESSE